MSYHPLVSGVVATVLGAIYLAAFVAVGTFFIGEDDDPVTPIGSILIGAGITGFALAIGAALGWVPWIIIAIAVALFIVLVLRWRQTRAAIAPPLSILADLTQGVFSRLLFGALMLAMWVLAVAPPHSAGALRYHLAHNRQILSEGAWTRIADFYFAIPFGWSILFMPFEWIHLPQGARLMSFGLYLITVGALLRAVDINRRMAVAVVIFFFVQPAIINSFTSATANGYGLMCMLAVVVTLMRPNPSSRRSMLGGFVIWIPIIARYQQLGVAILATVVWLVYSRRFEDAAAKRRAFAIGALAAFALASPFYFANLKWFGNPLWPLFITAKSAAGSYADLVAYTQNRAQSGWMNSMQDEVTGSQLLVALVVLVALIISIASKQAFAKRTAIFGFLLVATWLVIQPFVFMNLTLLSIPVAACALAFAFSTASIEKPAALRLTGWAMAIGIPLMLAVNVYVARDAFRYFVTGDVARYHVRTGFYRTFTWVNDHSPKLNRFLTIVRDGQTYYLDRRYRRADPMVGGQVDWNRINTGKALIDEMTARGFDAIVYEDRDWSRWPGGANLERAIADAIANHQLIQVQRVRELEYQSNLARSPAYTNVLILTRRGHWNDT